jgi:hypothetical protein
LCVNKSQFVPVIFEPPCKTRKRKDRKQVERMGGRKEKEKVKKRKKMDVRKEKRKKKVSHCCRESTLVLGAQTGVCR